MSMLNPYLGNISVEEFSRWCRNPEFVEFLLTVDDVELDLYLAREQAKNVLLDIVGGDFADAKKASVQLKAAQILLDREKDSGIKNLSQKIQVSGGAGYKVLEKKPVAELQEELRRLQESN